jgi:hypothetical protein
MERRLIIDLPGAGPAAPVRVRAELAGGTFDAEVSLTPPQRAALGTILQATLKGFESTVRAHVTGHPGEQGRAVREDAQLRVAAVTQAKADEGIEDSPAASPLAEPGRLR